MGEASTWQAALRGAYRSVAGLREAGLLPAAYTPGPSIGGFRLSVPRYYARLIDPALGLSCPILRQAVPVAEEVDPALPAWAQALSQRAWGRPLPWHGDAIGDLARQAAPRLTHRYRRRALLHVSPACALSCRYCFRRDHLAAGEARLYRGGLAPALAYLHAHPEIREVILTGGDPLSLPDSSLEALLDLLVAVPHLRHVRVHSRMPVTLPARITAPLAALLGRRGRLGLSLMTHFNHPREWTRQARRAMERLRVAGVPTYNQSVLLAGVNDRLRVLLRLFQGLYEGGVAPVYLHHPDWTPGTFHFRPSIAHGRRLARALIGRLSGPAVPRYVVDLPGGRGKQSLLDAGVVRLSRQGDAEIAGSLWRLPLPAVRPVAHAPVGEGRGEGEGERHVLYACLSPRRRP